MRHLTLIAEREDVVAALHTLCDELDFRNDWDDQDHLADVINKHCR